jgi:tRNA 2-selenouridine synthase
MPETKSYSQVQELAELLEEINGYDLQDISFNDIITDAGQITQQDFLQILKKSNHDNKNYIIIDVRSENEFANNAIPYSVNLPILDNIERHKVGLIYAQYSKEKALSLAYYYAKIKEKDFIKNAVNLSKDKEVIVYCWRGGVRSKYVCALLQKYNINVKRLQSGQKGFRKIVQDFLYNNTVPVVSLSGLTGCGKSEILEYIQKTFPGFPVIHLEQCAGHASSVFGEIRFLLKGETCKNQQQFETNIFMEILPYISDTNPLPVFLSENESKKIGGLNIPPAVQNGLEKQNYINLECVLHKRVLRLVKDYFVNDMADENLKNSAKEKVAEQLNFLSKKLSREKIIQYKELIRNNKFSDFLTDILENYYDRIYKRPVKKPLLSLEVNQADKTVEEILKFWKENLL